MHKVLRLSVSIVMLAVASVSAGAQEGYIASADAAWGDVGVVSGVASAMFGADATGRVPTMSDVESLVFDYSPGAVFLNEGFSAPQGLFEPDFDLTLFSTFGPSYDDTASRPKNTLSSREARKAMSFAERNSGAFKRRKHGGVRSPGMAALCSALVPGLGQCYNAQWYKPPVIYAGAAVLGYFIRENLNQKRVYEKELLARFENDTLGLNPLLQDRSKEQLLDLRNYYQQYFELSLILSGVLYALNIIDAVVYAHLFDFNVTPNLSMRVEPYACPDWGRNSRSLPIDMGFRLCMKF